MAADCSAVRFPDPNLGPFSGGEMSPKFEVFVPFRSVEILVKNGEKVDK